MKNCTNCGAQMADDATFCANCGTAVQAEVIPAAPAAAQKPALDIKKLLPIGIGAVALIIVIALIAGIAGSGYKNPVKYYEQMLNGNFKNIEKIIPEKAIEESEEDIDFDDLVEEAEEEYELYLEELEEDYGDNVKIDIKITDKDVLKEKKLNNIRDGLKDNYDIPKKSVTKAYKLELELSIKGSDDEETDDLDVIVAKIDGKWYMVTSGGSLDLPF